MYPGCSFMVGFWDSFCIDMEYGGGSDFHFSHDVRVVKEARIEAMGTVVSFDTTLLRMGTAVYLSTNLLRIELEMPDERGPWELSPRKLKPKKYSSNVIAKALKGLIPLEETITLSLYESYLGEEKNEETLRRRQRQQIHAIGRLRGMLERMTQDAKDAAGSAFFLFLSEGLGLSTQDLTAWGKYFESVHNE